MDRAPHELGFIAALAPLYLRGQAYLMLGMPRQAAEQFQRILDNRGPDPFSPFHAVAPLGLARACAAAREVDQSVKAYERFLSGWTEADRDLPVLREARDEYDACCERRPRTRRSAELAADGRWARIFNGN